MADAAQETQAPAVVTEKPIAPFTGVMTTGENRATEKIEMQRATAQVYASHQRAIQYPRDEQRCIQRIYDTCKNVHFAADAMYRVPRGSDKVEGLNVKAAKEFARIWGNLEYGTVNHGDYGNMSQFEAYSHDLETNVPFRTSYTVKHQRSTRNGNVELTDDQSIGEIQKARNSKEIRNAILSQLPEYVKDEAIRTIKRTLHQAVQDVPAAWNGAKAQFELMGVKPASLCRFLNKPINKTPECLDAADIVELRFLLGGIKENKALLDEVFPERDKSKVPAAKKEEQSSTDKNQAATNKPAPSNSTTTKENSPTESQAKPSSVAGETKPAASQSQTKPSTATQKPVSASKPSGKPASESKPPAKKEEPKPSLPVTPEPPAESAESSPSETDTEPTESLPSSTDEEMNFSPETEQNADETPPSDDDNQNQSESEDSSDEEADGEEPQGDEGESHDPEDEVQPGDTF